MKKREWQQRYLRFVTKRKISLLSVTRGLLKTTTANSLVSHSVTSAAAIRFHRHRHWYCDWRDVVSIYSQREYRISTLSLSLMMSRLWRAVTAAVTTPCGEMNLCSRVETATEKHAAFHLLIRYDKGTSLFRQYLSIRKKGKKNIGMMTIKKTLTKPINVH